MHIPSSRNSQYCLRQNGKTDRNIFRWRNVGSIIVQILQINVPKIEFRAQINVAVIWYAVIWYRRKRQNLFTINSKRNISIQKGVHVSN